MADGPGVTAEGEAAGAKVIGQLAALARARLPAPTWDYLSGGAGSEGTIRRNRAALEALGFRRRVLRDVSSVDPSTALLGDRLRIPAFLAPIGSLGVLHDAGAAASARAAGRFGTTLFYGVNSETPAVQVVGAGGNAPVFQLYLRDGRSWWEPLVASLRDLGFRALCITVDLPVAGRRERDVVNGFSSLAAFDRPNIDRAGPSQLARADWPLVRAVAAAADLPLILKGIATAEDAALAVEAGAAAVYVSNHGGRQLDDEPATIELLPEIASAVAGRAAILVDGGFTNGRDVLKAVALGASAVGLGKLHGWALAAGGEAGVVRMLELLEGEIRDAMAQLGVRALAELTPAFLRPLSPVPPGESWVPVAGGGP